MDEKEDPGVISNLGMNQGHGALEDNEDQESEQEKEDDDQQTVLQNAQRVRGQRRAMARRTIQEVEGALDGETLTIKAAMAKVEVLSGSSSQTDSGTGSNHSGHHFANTWCGEVMKAELETVNAFQTDVQMALAAIQEALRGYASGVKMEEGDGGKRNVTMKLPKLNLRRFNGDPRNWFPFWDSFERAIHKRKDLTERDKFDYLKGLLDGEAHDSI